MLLNINVEQKHLNHLSFPGPSPNGIVYLHIQNLPYTAFRKHFIDEFGPIPNSVFNTHNPVGIKLISQD